MQKLTAKTWIYTLPQGYTKSYDVTVNYSITSEMTTISYSNGSGSDSRAYYLSNTIETLFDDNKVGTVQNGKYIIIDVHPSAGARSVEVNEIIELTSAKLTVKALRTNQILNFIARII
jgi:hypothetical protein